MRYYVVLLIHLMFWSFFTLAKWLSRGDHIEYHLILFMVFLYLSIQVAMYILKTKRGTLFTTFAGLLIYFSLQKSLSEFDFWLVD
ncbi:MAG TPA: hypothetical protein VEY51_05020 [Chondromyces sp.]|nr:hypothetical protein [Chondromyces sp.]